LSLQDIWTDGQDDSYVNTPQKLCLQGYNTGREFHHRHASKQFTRQIKILKLWADTVNARSID